MSQAGSWLPWPPADVLPVPRPALATCQVSRRHQGLEKRTASGWEPCPVTWASPVTAGAAAFPPACPWLLLQGTPHTPVTELPAGVKVPVLAHLRGCRGAERLMRAARGWASNGTCLCESRAHGRLIPGCPLCGCFSLWQFGQARKHHQWGVWQILFLGDGDTHPEVGGGGWQGPLHPQRP